MTVQRNLKAEETRERILEITSEEMCRVGFRAMGLNDILHKLKMSKGALYHHFRNKLELGYAVLDELYATRFSSQWVSPLDEENPLQATIECLEAMPLAMEEDNIRCGCPINNLATEMSPIDEGFRLRIERVYKRWHSRLIEAFLRAQDKGYMRKDVKAEEVAIFLIATVQGAFTISKNSQNSELFIQVMQPLNQYLRSLQTTPSQTKLTLL